MLLTRARPATLPQLRALGVTHGALITEPFYSELSRAACSNREITEWWESSMQAGGFGPALFPTPASVGPPTKLQGFHLPHDKAAPWCGATCLCVRSCVRPSSCCNYNILSIVLVILAESSLVVHYVMCSVASGNYPEVNKSGIDIWTHEGKKLEDCYFTQHYMKNL